MGKQRKDKNDKIFYILLGIFILVRIFLITGIPKNLATLRHDDLYYAKAAHSIIHGKWLGEYSHLTIIKAPFYSLFMILSFFTGLSLNICETVFYVVACTSLVFALSPLIKNRWWQLIIFVFMCFVPSSLATAINIRVYREFVNFSLTLYIISFSIGLYLRFNSNVKTFAFWAAGLGLFLGAFFITREEGIWILPTIILLLSVLIIKIVKNSNEKNKILRISILASILILTYIPTIWVSYLNYKHYDFWGISENLDKDYLSIRNSLCSIKTSQSLPYRPISREALSKAYEVSPGLRELQNYIDDKYDTWLAYSDIAVGKKPKWYTDKYFVAGQQLGNGHFIWMLRDALADSGYYSKGKFPSGQLHLIAQELKNACENGSLDCKKDMNLPLIGSVNKDSIFMSLHFLVGYFKDFFSYEYVDIADMDIKEWADYHSDFEYYREFVYNPIEFDYFGNKDPDAQLVGGKPDIRMKMISIKQKITEKILDIYKAFSLPLMLLNIFGVVYSLVKKQIKLIFDKDSVLILLFTLCLLLTRLGVLAVLDVTTAIPGTKYFLSCYLFVYTIMFMLTYKLARFYFPDVIKKFQKVSS